MIKSWERHVFHAVLESWMIKLGQKIAGKLKIDFSELINLIFSLCRTRIYYKHCTDDDQESRYKTLEEAQDKNIAMFEYNYQQLKKMHHDLNSFSISRLLRDVLEDFFALVNELGLDKAIIKLKKESAQWQKKVLKRGRQSNLNHSDKEMNIKKGIIAIYNLDFKLQRINFRLPEP